MSDIRIRKRKRLRSKDIKSLAGELEAILGTKVFDDSQPVDRAESPDFDLIFVGNDILGLIMDGKPFLTVRGVLQYKPARRFVTVDMGAVQSITSGADCMGPGIVEADDGIAEGDFVWIRDVKNKTCLAVGASLRDTEGLRSKRAGKAIRSLACVGDRLWKAGN